MYSRQHKTYLSILTLVAFSLISTCARISSPQGGPEDTSPPQLLESSPSSGSTMFQSKEIKLTFNERVKIENIQSNLLITPSINSIFQTKVKKNEVTLSFDKDFNENTTYTLSFGGSIADITNNNRVRNLSISFSTGPVIDSLSIEGKLKNLYSQQPVEETLVALYNIKDTLNILTGKASYYAFTDSAGTYRFQNLPSASYVVTCVVDNNNNGFADSNKELYGFYPDTLALTKNLINIDFTLQRLNLDSLEIRSSRSYGSYFETTFSKPIQNFYSANKNTFYYQQIEPNVIRFYKNEAKYMDTIPVIFQVQDSTGFVLNDTINMVFQPSDAGKDPLQISAQPSSQTISPSDTLQYIFSKPLKSFISDSLTVRKDSSIIYNFKETDFKLSTDRTILSSLKPITQYSKSTSTFNINVGPNAFFSVDQDTSSAINQRYNIATSDNSAIISGLVSSQYPVIIHLLSARGDAVLQHTTNKNFKFENLSAGRYRIRVIKDLNNNGKWDIGNLLLFEPPEPAKFYFDNFYNSEIIEVRSNWEINDANVNF